MNTKTRIYHFNNGSGGGVLSVISNLIAFSENEAIENHVIYTIEASKKDQATIIDFPKAASVQVFHYHKNWNFYHTCKQLAKLLHDDKAVVVAHDWLELGMCSQLGLQNPVIQFLHGDFEYYYQLALKHSEVIDYHICVSLVIMNKLLQLSQELSTKVKYCRFPVPDVEKSHKIESEKIRIIFCVRDLNEERKQFELLPIINKILRDRKVGIKWSVIGKGKTEIEIREILECDASYFDFLPNSDVINEMQKNDIFLLPSLAEGFPVAVVEAMKCGLVPMATDWDGATLDLILDGETGYSLSIKDARGYADKIERLSADRKKLKMMSARAQEIAQKLFDPIFNTQENEEVFLMSTWSMKKKHPKRVYGSRLDRGWIPNGVVKWIRKNLKEE